MACWQCPSEREASAWRPSLKSMADDCAAELCREVDRELQASQLEDPAPCAGSAALAVLWSRFFHATDNARFRAVASRVSPSPGQEALHFVVDLRKRSQQQRFGLELTELEGALLVTGVERQGCVESWNDHCSRLQLPWKRLHLCAALLQVNGLSTVGRMKKELATSSRVALVACNPPSLHDAVTMLRMVRAAAPPHGRPFWLKTHKRLALSPLERILDPFSSDSRFQLSATPFSDASDAAPEAPLGTPRESSAEASEGPATPEATPRNEADAGSSDSETVRLI